MPISGARTATFHYAFEDDVPRVLKIPQVYGKVECECALYEEIGSRAEQLGLSLVPVKKLKLRRSIRTNRFSPEKLVSQGILTPAYWCTLGEIPPPASKGVLRVLSVICPALKFIDDNGWIHGDIKPSNILLGDAGNPWLGGYDTSIKKTSLAHFTGGTPKYRLLDVGVEQGGRFDRVGLALSCWKFLV